MNKGIATLLALGLAIAGCGQGASSEDLGKAQLGAGGFIIGCPTMLLPQGGSSGFAGAAPAPPPIATFQNGLTLSNGKTYSGEIDAMIDKGAPTTNYGALDYVQVKGGANQRHGLAKWDLSSLPPATNIRIACVTLDVTDASRTPYPAYELLLDWAESQATWNQATSSTAWQAPGAWGATDSSGTEALDVDGNLTGKVRFPVSSALVRKWVQSSAQNHGIVFGNNSSSDGLTFASGNSTSVASRPKLEIW